MAVAKQASDLFALGGDFKAQSSTVSNENNQTIPVYDADGNFSCESAAFGDKESVSVEYKSCSSALGTALPAIGSVSGGYLIESIAVSTSATDTPTISISGHNHTTAPHTSETSAAWPVAVIAELDAIVGKKGAVDFFGNDGADIATQSSTITGSCQHVEAVDADGDNLAGANYDFKLEASAEYIGLVSAIADVTWTLDSDSQSDSNTEFDSSSVSGHLNLVGA